MKNDYVFIWPKNSIAWPGSRMVEKPTKWEDGTEVEKVEIVDWYKKYANRIGSFHNCSGDYFLEKKIFDLIKDYNIDLSDDLNRPEKSRVEFKSQKGQNINMEGYYFSFECYFDDDDTVIDLEKSEYTNDGIDYNFTKVVLHENIFNEMSQRYDIFQPSIDLLYNVLLVKREILNIFLDNSVTGLCWCEVEDFNHKLYKELEEDEILEDALEESKTAKRDYVLMWPKDSKAWPSTHSDGKDDRWESDSSEAKKFVVSSYYRKSTKQIGEINSSDSGGLLVEKKAFDILNKYKIDYKKRRDEAFPDKVRLDFKRKAGNSNIDLGMDGYWFRLNSYNPEKVETVIDLENSQYIYSGYWRKDLINKIVLNEEVYKEMTSKYDIFKSIRGLLLHTIFVKREIVEELLNNSVTGFAWCEIDDFTHEIYEQKSNDETSEVSEENEFEIGQLNFKKCLKLKGLNINIQADSEDSLKFFQETYKGNKREKLFTNLYQSILEDPITADTIFQHHLNEEGDFSHEIESDSWSEERQVELIKENLSVCSHSLSIVDKTITRIGFDLGLLEVVADIKQDGSVGEITVQ